MAVLIALRSALLVAAARVNRLSITGNLNKTPSHYCLGVFVSALYLYLYLFSLPVLAESRCAASGDIEWAQLKKIVDGDTLHLRDGRKVRVMGINTPEIGHRKNNKPHYPEPLASAAKQAAEEFFAGASRVGLSFGEQRADHYGRILAHVYRADGHSLSAYLLGLGFAWQVVVPPNEQHWRCLAAVETTAKKQALGIWGNEAYRAKQAKDLSMSDTGFQRLTGQVIAVNRSRGGWWVQLDKLAIRVRDKHLKYLDGVNPQDWLNRRLIVRGWVKDRSQSSAVMQQGYSPLMMNLQHSAMLK